MERTVKRQIMLNVLPAVVLGVLVTGCAAPARHAAFPDARPLGAEYPTGARGTADTGAGEDQAPPEPTGALTLRQALATALLRSPGLEAFSYDVRAAEARLLQAQVLPNPELEVEIEEYDRDGQGFDSAEMAVVLGQLFELGGKRRWRTRIAEAEGELTGWDYEAMRLDVFTSTAKRFMAVIAAQRRLELARSAVELAEKTSRAVGVRVSAGKEPPLQASKAEAELEMARLEALRLENVLVVSRRKLAAMWGADRAIFESVEGDLDSIPDSIPSLRDLRSRLPINPDLARWDAELRLRRAAVASEKAARVPDLEAAVGLQRFEEDGTDSLAFGIGVPLPLFDRNHGNIRAAEHDLARAEAERAAEELALAAELGELHAALTAAYRQARALRSKVVPAMAQAFEAAHEGYRQGKFGFLDMLDAQRGLFEAEGALVDALSDYHAALADIQRLTGTGVEGLQDKNQKEAR